MGENGTAGRHRLEENEWCGLDVARQEEEVAGREPRGDVVDASLEGAPAVDAEAPCAGLDTGARRTVSEKRDANVQPFGEEPREDVDDDSLSLPAVEGSGVNEAERGSGERRTLDEREGRETVGDDGDLSGRDSGREER